MAGELCVTDARRSGGLRRDLSLADACERIHAIPTAVWKAATAAWSRERHAFPWEDDYGRCGISP
jgi:hypothetical protein